MALNFHKKISTPLVLVPTSLVSFCMLAPLQGKSIECFDLLNDIDCMLLGTGQIKELIEKLKSIKINGNALSNISNINIEGPYPEEKSKDERDAYAVAKAFSSTCEYFSERLVELKNKICNAIIYKDYENRFLLLEEKWQKLCLDLKNNSFNCFYEVLKEIDAMLKDLYRSIKIKSNKNEGLLQEELTDENLQNCDFGSSINYH